MAKTLFVCGKKAQRKKRLILKKSKEIVQHGGGKQFSKTNVELIPFLEPGGHIFVDQERLFDAEVVNCEENAPEMIRSRRTVVIKWKYGGWNNEQAVVKLADLCLGLETNARSSNEPIRYTPKLNSIPDRPTRVEKLRKFGGVRCDKNGIELSEKRGKQHQHIDLALMSFADEIGKDIDSHSISFNETDDVTVETSRTSCAASSSNAFKVCREAGLFFCLVLSWMVISLQTLPFNTLLRKTGILYCREDHGNPNFFKWSGTV
jgi:hypothetical protein